MCDDYVAHAHFNATTVVQTYGGCMFRDNAPAFIAALDDLCAVVHEASGASQWERPTCAVVEPVDVEGVPTFGKLD